MISSLFFQFADNICQKSGGFFGLKPWYHYLPPEDFDNTCTIKHFVLLPGGKDNPSDVPLVLLAIADDLLRIAGVVAVGFVIVGAIRYITSQGQPEDTAKAQATIINALIGLAVAIFSVAFVSFLGAKLGG